MSPPPKVFASEVGPDGPTSDAKTRGRTRIRVAPAGHLRVAGPARPAAAYAARAGCDRIIHCGDLPEIGVVDRLEALAPTVACSGNGDPVRPRRGRPGVADDPRVADVHVLDVG